LKKDGKRMGFVENIKCNHCGIVYKNIFTTTGRVQCWDCGEWINEPKMAFNPFL